MSGARERAQRREKLRVDGRSADQMRALKIAPDFYFHRGRQRVDRAGKDAGDLYGDGGRRRAGFLKGSGKGWVTSEYGMLPRATEERTAASYARETIRRTLEIQRLIGRSLRAVTDQEALGEPRVARLHVIQADGGTRTASITGAFVALALAFERMWPREC